MKFATLLISVLLAGSAFGGDIFKKKKPEPSKSAPTPTMTEFWKQSGMDLATTRKLMSNQFCYSVYIRNFTSCVLAAKEAVETASDGELVLTTKLHMEKYPEEYSDAVAEIGDMRIAKSKFKPSGNIVEVFKASREKFERDLALDQDIKAMAPDTYDFDELLNWLDRNHLNAANEAEVSGKTVTKMLKVIFDPHTYIMPKAYFDYASSADSKSFAGVGVTYSFLHGFMVIEKVIKNGPAAAAGLRAKDVVTHIDGQSLKDKKAGAIGDMVKGEEGTEVTFTVERGDQTFDVIVKRGIVKIDNVEYERLPTSAEDVGYIKLRSFMPEKSCSDMKRAIEDMTSEPGDMAGLIVDLRGNGGGRLDLAVCIVNLFVGPGKTVVTARDPDTNKVLQALKTTDPQLTALPVAVLIDARSASASEIVSGALKDYERALIVGEKSFGKGTIQSLGQWQLNAKVTLAKTTARFHMASGWSNQMTGVASDIEVYRKPNPTELDKFAIRESDEFLPINAGPDSFAASAAHQAFVGKVSDCLSKSDNAEREFASEATEYFDPDFQLLEAKDALNCMANL